MKNRCEECGSWGEECGSKTPVKGCGCARCANARVHDLEETLQKIIALCGDDLIGFADIQHVAIQGLSLVDLWAEWHCLVTYEKKPSQKLQDMLASGKLNQYPALVRLINWPQDPEWHPEGCVWRHTLHTVDAAVQIADRDNLSKTDRAILVLSALCHDFGKPETTTRNEKGRISSPEHDKAGVPFALSFLEYIGAPKDIQESVSCLVSEHMVHVGAIINPRLVRRLLARLEGKTTVAMLNRLIEADHAGRPPLPLKHPCPELVKISEECLAEDSKSKPFLQGKDLLSLGFEPGVEMGYVLKKAYELQLQETLPTKEAAVEWAVSYQKELRKQNKFAGYLDKVLTEVGLDPTDIKEFWKQICKKKGIDPRTFEEKERIGKMTDDEIVVCLQGILDKNKSGTFCGGTLCIPYTEEDGSEDVQLLNISNEKLRPDIRKLLAEIYLQYKTPDHAFWALAQDIMFSLPA